MKHRGTDLTQGPILSHLFRLALPTIGASFMQMTYNLTDMLWLGRVGEEAVAAVGAAGFYVWFGLSLLLITRVGAEVGVSQSLGSRQHATALRFVRHALFLVAGHQCPVFGLHFLWRRCPYGLFWYCFPKRE